MRLNLTVKNKRIIPFIIIAVIVLLMGVVGPITSLIPIPESFKKAFIGLVSQRGVFTLKS